MSPRVAIIGAGVGGIALGVKLKKAGIDTFTIFEKSDGPGGTWWDNTYPGAACDVSSVFYSFSFMAWDWTETHATQPEILEYIQAVVDRLGLRPHMRFKTGVSEVVWDEDNHRHTVRTDTGGVETFDIVVSAVGMLNVPNYPNWPGLKEFEGPQFHTSRWRHDQDLTGLRVAVVGGGSTTAQIVPSIAPAVERLYLFQKEPGWVAPKAARHYSADERERFRRWPLLQRYERLKSFFSFEKLRSASDPKSENQRNLKATCERMLEGVIVDPALRAKITPTHAVFCKRPILSSDFYPALNRPNVELIAQEVTGVTRNGVVDAAGGVHEVDALILATGFRAADYLATLDVKGRNGAGLHETWAGEPLAFLGLAVPNFPNFYMLYGPGTNGGSIIFKLECQADWIVGIVKRMKRSKITAVEVKPSAYRRFNDWLDRENGKQAWQDGCDNYFTSASGRVVTQWPGSMTLYWIMTKAFNRLAMIDRRRSVKVRTEPARDGPARAPVRVAELAE